MNKKNFGMTNEQTNIIRILFFTKKKIKKIVYRLTAHWDTFFLIKLLKETQRQKKRYTLNRQKNLYAYLLEHIEVHCFPGRKKQTTKKCTRLCLQRLCWLLIFFYHMFIIVFMCVFFCCLLCELTTHVAPSSYRVAYLVFKFWFLWLTKVFAERHSFSLLSL